MARELLDSTIQIGRSRQRNILDMGHGEGKSNVSIGNASVLFSLVRKIGRNMTRLLARNVAKTTYASIMRLPWDSLDYLYAVLVRKPKVIEPDKEWRRK